MTIATLMVVNDPFFPFDHSMVHTTYYGVMWPLTRFSALPYLLDPIPAPNLEASPWNLRHQTAHDDAANILPAYYGADTTGLPINQPVVDTNFTNPDQLTWWEFVNLTEHQIADNSILPPYPGQLWIYPFA